MFPTMPVQANKQERQLVKIFKSLDSANKDALVAFAEFLQIRSMPDTSELQNKQLPSTEPLDIPRPDKESVIKAIKRLSDTYPMVDKENILHPITDLMTAHMLQGKKANDVINELQEIFFKEYESLIKYKLKPNDSE
jgi:hypothetical protein